MKKSTKGCILIGTIVAAVLLPPFVMPIFVPWSEINCEHQDINIKTGQARYSRIFWFIKMSEKVEDTVLSRALDGETVDAADIDAWWRVNTFSPGVGHSPHYIFHGALHQVHQIERILSTSDLTPERKREISTRVLSAWQQSGNGSSADEYIHNLHDGGGF